MNLNIVASDAVRVLGPDNAIDVDKPSAHLELGASPNKESKKKKRALMEINEDNLKPYGIALHFY
jgi:hypothetical protein